MAISNGFPILVQEGTQIQLVLADTNETINIISERLMLFEELSTGSWGPGLFLFIADNMYHYYYNSKRFPKYKGNKIRYIKFDKSDTKAL